MKYRYLENTWILSLFNFDLNKITRYKTLQKNTKKNFLSQNMNIKDINCFNIHCNALLYA
jgi:hypothetical protein